MAAIYSNGGNRWNVLGFKFTKRDALSSLYKISMVISSLIDRNAMLSLCNIIATETIKRFHSIE